MKNVMQLKAIVRNIAKEKRITAQLVLQNYMLERFLERVSVSDYQENFIIKGGFLIASLVGLNSRTTMDMDATIKRYPVSRESVRNMIEEIIRIDLEDDIMFTFKSIGEIREGDEYTGYKALSSLLKKHKELFCIILAIGINDLQKFYSVNDKDIENGLSNLIEIIKAENPKTKIIIASPSNITEHITDGDFKIMFDKSSIEKSKKLTQIYKVIATQKNCIFVDLNEIATVSTKDGLHYEEAEHEKIAQAMFKELSKLV